MPQASCTARDDPVTLSARLPRAAAAGEKHVEGTATLWPPQNGRPQKMLLAVADLCAHAALFAPQLPPTLTCFFYAQGRLRVMIPVCPNPTFHCADAIYPINKNHS
jgi:hypothetical protein